MLKIQIRLIKEPDNLRGTWMAQLVKHLTLDFGSGHNFWVVRSNAMSGSMVGKELT